TTSSLRPASASFSSRSMPRRSRRAAATRSPCCSRCPRGWSAMVDRVDRARPPLRLLVVGSSWPPQTFLGRLLRGLSAAGVRLRIAFTEWPNQEWFHRAGLRTFKTRDWRGPRVVRLAWLAWLSLRALIVSPRALAIFWRHARAQKSRSGMLRALNRLL